MKDKDLITRLIRPEIHALQAYHVPDSAGLIKLDAMENPYTWPEALKQEWLEILRTVPINRYPDPSARSLRAQLKQSLAMPAGMDVLLGNGSDELIQLVLIGVARPGAVVLAPTPTFVMYAMIATFVGMQFVGVPLATDFGLDLAAIRAAIKQHQPAVVFLAYPNNPTGNLFDATDIESILREAPGLVVLDEAYHAFAQQSFMSRLGQYDNLLVMRTLSKQGLAGLRLGILAGDPAWLAELDKLRLPYNINSLTQASAEFALQHMDVLDEQATRLRAERERLLQELATLTGVRVWPSAANFILFRTDASADTVFAALRQQGVLIKNLSGAAGVLANCLRVTVGTPEENTAFLAALRKAL
jgi:histidinol-phosphate aminotransferase